jgi:hypothetical protein
MNAQTTAANAQLAAPQKMDALILFVKQDDHLDFNQAMLRQRRHLNGAARRRLLAKNFAVESIDRGKVPHVGQEDGSLDDIRDAGTCFSKHSL